MNDRYLFRGKRKDNGKWIYGGIYYQKADEVKEEAVYIIGASLNDVGAAYEVIPETVEQCTGLTDKNGRLIFEGDIMISPIGRKGIVSFGTYKPWSTSDSDDFESWKLSVVGMNNTECGLGKSCTEFMKVIGNIHDNPELLEVEE